MPEVPKNKIGFGRLLSAFGYSWQGLTATFQTEAAFRQEIYAGLILVPLSFLLADTTLEWLLLILTYTLILLAELMNTAIEAVVDRLGGDFHELSGKAKDVGSAAVLVAIALAVITWSTILFF